MQGSRIEGVARGNGNVAACDFDFERFIRALRQINAHGLRTQCSVKLEERKHGAAVCAADVQHAVFGRYDIVHSLVFGALHAAGVIFRGQEDEICRAAIGGYTADAALCRIGAQSVAEGGFLREVRGLHGQKFGFGLFDELI